MSHNFSPTTNAENITDVIEGLEDRLQTMDMKKKSIIQELELRINNIRNVLCIECSHDKYIADRYIAHIEWLEKQLKVIKDEKD